MEEEISIEEKYPPCDFPLMDILIEKYFTGIEERIQSAKTLRQAIYLVNQACRNFQRECQSEIIPLFFIRHMKKLLQLYWGNK